MTEVEYQNECSRAELLGLPKPTWEEFLAKIETLPKTRNEEIEEEITTEGAEEKDLRQEGFAKIGGGLDELNNILISTQRKLNSFKTVCGSFSRILKIHIGSKKSDETGEDLNSTEGENLGMDVSSVNQNNDEAKMTPDSPQLHQNKDTNSSQKNLELDKLDSLISKAERAELSLSSQNKQMKRFLNK